MYVAKTRDFRNQWYKEDWLFWTILLVMNAVDTIYPTNDGRTKESIQRTAEYFWHILRHNNLTNFYKLVIQGKVEASSRDLI